MKSIIDFVGLCLFFAVKKRFRFLYPLLAAVVLLSCNSPLPARIEIKEYTPIVRSDPTEADKHFNLGVYYSLTENNQESIREFRKAIDLEPEDGEAYFRLGMELHKTGQAEESKNAFTKSLNLGEIKTTHSNMGLIYYMLERRAEAVEELKYAISEDEPTADRRYQTSGII